MNLYNGNISAMMTHLGAEHFPTDMSDAVPGMLGMAYRYDQLNRITEAKGFTNFTASGWQAENQNPIYGTRYSYDANGNLLTLKRHDAEGTLFDDFTYNYAVTGEVDEDDNLLHIPLSNRLYHVNDAVPNTPMEGDIEDQGAFTADVELINTDNNYSYSALGEMVRDGAEGIDEIVWRVDGKIAEIRRTAGDAFHLKFRYDAHGNRIAKHVFANDDTWKSSTYYVRDAQGNVLSTYTHTTEQGTLDGASVTLATYKQTERHIYGSSRLGMETRPVELIATSVLSPYWADASVVTTNADDRVYELSNHLGNVLATFTARKLPLTEADVVVGFAPHLTSLSDYYPFGSGMEGRTVTEGYRYSFQGQETDAEYFNGAVSFKYRVHDARLGRFLSIDPLAPDYPWNSTYAFAENMLIHKIELEGLEAADPPMNQQEIDAAQVRTSNGSGEKYSDGSFSIGGDFFGSGKKNEAPSERGVSVQKPKDVIGETVTEHEKPSTQPVKKATQPTEVYKNARTATTGSGLGSFMAESSANETLKETSRYFDPNVTSSTKTLKTIKTVSNRLGWIGAGVESATHIFEGIGHFQKGNTSEGFESSLKAGGAVAAAFIAGATYGAIGGPIGVGAGILIGVGWAYLSELDWSPMWGR